MNIWFILILISWCVLMFCSINMMKSFNEAEELTRKLLRENRIKNEYLTLMRMKAVGYDGYNTIKGLKSLIDELDIYCKLALENDDLEPMYMCGDGSTKNILEEDLEEKDHE